MTYATLNDIENAVNSVIEPHDCYEAIFYFTKDESLWLLSEMKRLQYECTGQVLSGLIDAARAR